jgi:hypothetical protein
MLGPDVLNTQQYNLAAVMFDRASWKTRTGANLVSFSRAMELFCFEPYLICWVLAGLGGKHPNNARCLPWKRFHGQC